MAGMTCYKVGERSRLIYAIREYRGRKDEPKGFGWRDFRDLIVRAHGQLGGPIVLVWDNVRLHLTAGMREFELPSAYRKFLVELGASGAGPFYGLLPLEECRLFTMDRQPPDGTSRGFHHVNHPDALQGDLFLHIIEMGCTDLCLIGVTGPLTGRMLTGNADGFWPPNVSSAQDVLSWYERWLDHMRDGKDNDALGLTSPATVASAPWGPRARARKTLWSQAAEC